MNNINQEIEELKATAVKLQQQIEALEKPKQWKPTVSLDWVDRAHISTYTLLLKYVKSLVVIGRLIGKTCIRKSVMCTMVTTRATDGIIQTLLKPV